MRHLNLGGRGGGSKFTSGSECRISRYGNQNEAALVADVYYIITVRQILLCRFPKKSFGGNAIMTGRCSKTLNKSLVLINLT